jgi:transcription antitermination factor NusA-like protein
LNPAVALGLLLYLTRELRKLDKISNLINVMETLLREFSDEHIEIIPRVEVPKEETGINQIDLFVRIPVKKVYFVLCVRKYEQTKIVFHEEKARLMRRRKKGLKPLNPDPLEFLPSSTVWIQKNKRTIFGHKSNDRRRPCAKVFVLVGSTKIGTHRDELYDNLGENRFLTPKLHKPITVVHHDHDLCTFVRNYIAEKGKSPPNSSSQPQPTRQQGTSKSSKSKSKQVKAKGKSG